MSEGLRATFVDGLVEHDVTTTVTDHDGVASAVADAIDPPAVGAPAIDQWGIGAIDDLTVGPNPDAIPDATTGVTPATLGVARYGSIVIEPDGLTEPISLYPPRHVAILEASSIVADLDTAFEYLTDVFAAGGDAVVATGPSATADMGALVQGAHGPRTVHVVIVEADP